MCIHNYIDSHAYVLYIEKKSKVEQAQQPPSMEGQTHLILGNKKNEPSTTEKEREEKKQKKTLKKW